MASEPAARPEPPARKLSIPLIAGGVLLTVLGTGFITVAVREQGEVTPVQADSQNLAATSSPSTATPTAVATSTPTETATPTETRTKKPKAVRIVTAAPTTSPPKSKKPEKKEPAPARPESGAAYQLKNVATGKCVGALTIGSDAVQDSCAQSATFRLEPTRKVSGTQLYRFRDTGDTGRCLDIPDFGSKPNGTRVGAFSCPDPSSGDNQEWRLKIAKGEAVTGRQAYTVVNHASGICLGIANHSDNTTNVAVGAQVTIATCASKAKGFDDHLWIFI